MTADWPRVPLGELCTIERRQIAPDAPNAADLPYIGLEHVEQRTGRLLSLPPGEVIGTTFQFDARHVLYSKLRPYLNKVALPEYAGRCSTELLPLLPKATIDRRYLGWFLRQSWIAEAATIEAAGSRMPRAVSEKLMQVEVPLPPLAEQRRIVARVEAVTDRIADARRLRGETSELTRATVIAERSKRFNSLTQTVSPQPLGRVAECRLGKMVSGNKSEDQGIPYLRNANIRWDQLDLSSVYRIAASERERQELLLQPGDILVCEGRHLGKCAIWNGEIPGCIFQKALHRIRVAPDRILPRFILHHMSWSAERGDFTEKSVSTIPHLTGRMLKSHPVYIPPLPEQRRIVAQLDALQAKADAVRALQTETAAELDALLPAVLARAFAGEL